MDFISLDYLISSGAGGAAVWAAVRTHLQFLWRDVDQLRKDHADLKKEVAALAKGVLYENKCR